MMRKLCLVAACAAVLASPVAVLAQSPDQSGTAPLPSFDSRWYLLPYAAFTWADNNRGTDDGAGWGFAVGKPINEWLNLELRGTYTDLPSNGDTKSLGQGDFTIGDVGVDGLFVFNRRGTVQPFLLAGLGAINDDFDCDRITQNVGNCQSGTAWSFMAEAGAGVMVRIGDHAALRLDGRYRYDDNSSGLRRDDSFGDWVATAGLVIPIGGVAARPKTSRTYEPKFLC